MDSSDPHHADRSQAQNQSVLRAQLAAIIECSDDAIVSKNLQGIVTSWNQGAERIFGWTAEEMIGQPITQIIPPDRRDEEREILERLSAGERIDHFETVRITRDRRLIDISVTISPIRDETGRIIGASKIARDITLQKGFQKQLQDAKDAAEAASRAKDQFLGILSHELRTPLTPALVAACSLECDPRLPEDVREDIAMIRRNVETEARLVDDLLDLTRIARGKVRLHFEVVDAHAVIRNVLGMFNAATEDKRLTVVIALRARHSFVWADPGRLQQILLNLISNAVKFTPVEGTITVQTTNENGTIKVEVLDTGRGIEPELMPRLFQPFEQGDNAPAKSSAGLGLGLSIVKSLVEMHRASISVASDGLDRGAAFTLRMDTVRAPASTVATTPHGASTHRPFHVLLVEDHADTRAVISRLLTTLGCKVTATASVQQAIEAADARTFDLLLSDIGLPDGTGLDVMEHVRLRHHLKGIALSGYGQEEDIRRSRDAGFTAHLTKPVSLQTLNDAIRAATG